MVIHEVVMRWEQPDHADKERAKKGHRPAADVVVTHMERAAYGLSSRHIVVEKDGVVVRQWRDGEPWTSD